MAEFRYQLDRVSGGKPYGFTGLEGTVDADAASCDSPVIRQHVVDILDHHESSGVWRCRVSCGRKAPSRTFWYRLSIQIEEVDEPRDSVEPRSLFTKGPAS